MGYVYNSPPRLSAKSLLTASLYTADGGVDYSADGLLCGDGKAPIIENMWLSDGILTSRPSEERVCEIPNGAVYSHKAFGGSEILHIGSGLYRFFGEKLELICNEIPDRCSVAVRFSGKLYFYVGDRVFSVDKGFAAVEEEPYAPLYGTNYSRSLGTGVKNTEFEPNVLAPFVSVSYSKSASIEVSGYCFPRNMDRTRRFYVYCDGEKVEVTSDEKSFYLPSGAVPSGDNSVSIHYYTADSGDECGLLGGCTCGIAYGGGVLEGTRVILGGSESYPGRYFSSELGNPLFFKRNSGGVVSSSGEGITAFCPFGSDMLVFTESTVCRMRYNYTSEVGGYISVHTVSVDTGCDLPRSVCVCRGRVVFASRRGGIFVISGSEVFGTLNAVPISQNITDLSGKKGYFSLTDGDFDTAEAVVCGEKYIFTAGERAFVWDFGERAYTASSDYVKSAKNLVWFEFGGLRKSFAVFEHSGGMLKVCDGEILKLCGDDGVRSQYRSKNMDFGLPHVMKRVLEMRIVCRSKKTARANLSFYADGRKFYTANAVFEPMADGYSAYCVKLPSFSARRFYFEIECGEAKVGFMNVETDYKTDDSMNF